MTPSPRWLSVALAVALGATIAPASAQTLSDD